MKDGYYSCDPEVNGSCPSGMTCAWSREHGEHRCFLRPELDGGPPDRIPDGSVYCGNETIEQGEQCDGQDLGGQTCEGLGYPGGTLACTGTCTYDRSACHPPKDCGDGEIDPPAEECDGENLDGATCMTKGYEGGDLFCRSNCTFDTSGCYWCGNNQVNGTEECDGTDLGGQTCQSVTGLLDGSLACRSDCTFDTGGCHTCGNGTKEGPEACDGTDFGGQTCQGLGFFDGQLGCTGLCLYDLTGCTGCGNGVVDGTEQCDNMDLGGETCQSTTGLLEGSLACRADCTFDTGECHTCGNGTIEGPESCDGPNLGGQTCQGLGFFAGDLGCTGQCLFDLTGCTDCGNGSIDGTEQCDATDLGGETCQTVTGLSEGSLACWADCTFDTSDCHTCGNGTIEGSEACDGDDLGGQTCQGLGFFAGDLGCTGLCLFDLTGCTGCGNGVIDGTEQCDATDLGGETCISQGYASGTLACTDQCTFDASGCVPVKPNILVIVDTSGNMLSDYCDGQLAPVGDGVAGVASWILNVKEALSQVLPAVPSDEANFGLARFPQWENPCNLDDCSFGGSTAGFYMIDSSHTGGAENRSGCKMSTHFDETVQGTWFDQGVTDCILVPVTSAGAGLLPTGPGDFDPADANIPAIIPWLNHTTLCSSGTITDPEVQAILEQYTPLGRSLFYARFYFDSYVVPNDHPLLAPNRRNVVILITYGDETCDTDPTTMTAEPTSIAECQGGHEFNPVRQACLLLVPNPSEGHHYRIETHVIVHTGMQGLADTIALAGGTQQAREVNFGSIPALVQTIQETIGDIIP